MDKKINFLKEFILTFSNKASLLSSKKIERFFIFNILMILTIFYISINMSKLSADDFIKVIAVWLGYGGWNTYQTYRDKKLDLNTNSAKSTDTSNNQPPQ